MKVVISGYYGFGNAGDEAVLEAMLADLRTVDQNIRPIVLSADPDGTAERFGVEAVARLSWRAVRRAIEGASLFISGGGSLLQDATGWGSVPYYAGLMLVARWFRVPVMMYAQGVGPLHRPWLRALAGRAAAVADEVTVRDRQSYDTLRRLGVKPERMSVTADPVFGLLHPGGMDSPDDLSRPSRAATGAVGLGGRTPASADDRQEASGSSMRSLAQSWFRRLPAGPLIGVSARRLPSGDRIDTDAIVRALAAALQPRLERWNAYVVPLPLHHHSDGPVLKRLRQVLGKRVVDWPPDVVPGQLKARDWMDVLARLDLCLTMRLHGLIFAAAAATPFVALSDDPKVGAHVDLLGLDGRGCLVSPSLLVRQAPEEPWWERSASQAPVSGSGGAAVAGVGPNSSIEQVGGGARLEVPNISAGSSRAIGYTADLGAALDRIWRERGALRTHLRATVPALAASARHTAVRAIRLAESRANRSRSSRFAGGAAP